MQTLFPFFAAIVLDALVLPAASEGLNRADSTADSAVLAGLRWLVRVLLMPVEIVAQIMTFLGMMGAIYWAIFAFILFIICIIACAWQFMNQGAVPNAKGLIDVISLLL